eukprot:4981935-Prymnesium_polylepis.1
MLIGRPGNVRPRWFWGGHATRWSRDQVHDDGRQQRVARGRDEQMEESASAAALPLPTTTTTDPIDGFCDHTHHGSSLPSGVGPASVVSRPSEVALAELAEVGTRRARGWHALEGRAKIVLAAEGVPRRVLHLQRQPLFFFFELNVIRQAPGSWHPR